MSCLRANSESVAPRAIAPSSATISARSAAGYPPVNSASATPASVWPARSVKPPLTAMRGNMCPGLMKSVSRLVGLPSALIVDVRSCALTPVVMPCAKSTETVNAVRRAS